MYNNEVTVAFYGSVQVYTGGAESFIAKDCLNVRSLVDELGSHFGEGFRASLLSGENCFFLVNGKGIMSTGGLETALRPGDKVEVLPFIDAG